MQTGATLYIAILQHIISYGAAPQKTHERQLSRRTCTVPKYINIYIYIYIFGLLFEVSELREGADEAPKGWQ